MDRRAFIAGMAASLAGLGMARAAAQTDRQVVYLGSYSGSGKPRGHGLDIGIAEGKTGRLTTAGHVKGVPDASFLALSPSRRTLYTTNERVPKGKVTALDVASDPHRPRLLNSQSSGGSGPTHLSVHPNGRYLLTANYGDGTIAVHPLSDDGGIGALADQFRHTEKSRAHQVITAPGGRWVIAVDLGTDSVFVFGFETASGKLALHQHLKLPEGFAPRHMVFHPHAAYAYILSERRSQITVAAWDESAGRFTLGQTISTLGKGTHKRNYPAEIQITSDGRFLYASNRGADTIAIFSVSAPGDRLVFTGTVPCGGSWPRHFALDPSERWIYVANQKSNLVACLPRNVKTGMIGSVIHKARVNSVAMIQFKT